MHELWLFRHGQTEDNVFHRYGGWRDQGLTEAGRDDILLKRARGLYAGAEGLTGFVSDLRRARETAALAFPNHPFTTRADLREMGFGAFEGHTYDELKDDPAYQAWLADEAGDFVCPGGGESHRGFAARAWKAYEAIAGQTDRALVVAHGGIIYEIMRRLFPEENKSLYGWDPGNGCGFRVLWGPRLRYEAIQ